MKKIKALKCLKCGREYNETEVLYTCPACENDGILEVLYNYDAVLKEVKSKENLKENKDPSMWRYSAFLPADINLKPSLHIGWTPLYKSKRLSNELKLSNLWIKDDGRNPTASLKDRASAIAVIKAQELKKDTIVAASTGNAASSLAGLSASLGIKNYIFVPKTAPSGKIAQLFVFGAHIFAVNGSYDEAFDLSIKTTELFGFYNRNTAFNPYMVEGKKTVSLEIIEQLNFEVPDKIIVPVGDGCIISGVFKGLKDYYSLNFINKLPQLIAVQASGCSPIAKAVNENKPVGFLKNPHSIADSIVAGIPRNHLMAIRDIKESNGFAITVSDDEIIEGIKILGNLEGIFAEPAASSTVAALKKMVDLKMVDKDEKIVLLITGNGLKDIESAMKVKGTIKTINADINEVEKILKQELYS